MQQQFKANLLRLSENQSIGKAARTGQSFGTNLECDDCSDDDATQATQHDTFNEKPVAKGRHRQFTILHTLLQVDNRFGVAPEAFQPIEISLGGTEDVNDNITVIEQDPTCIGSPFTMEGRRPMLAEFFIYS